MATIEFTVHPAPWFALSALDWSRFGQLPFEQRFLPHDVAIELPVPVDAAGAAALRTRPWPCVIVNSELVLFYREKLSDEKTRLLLAAVGEMRRRHPS